MTSERFDIDISDVIELRNFTMWIKRELRLFGKQLALQEQIANNLNKVTSLPLEQLARLLNGD